jgi:hypothetical protein
MLRIGVWFDPRHLTYGGPTVVLLGTLLGLYQDALRRQKPIVILLNEPGDVNWIFDKTEQFLYTVSKCKRAVIGPMVFTSEPTTQPHLHFLYQSGHVHYVLPSDWMKSFVEEQLRPSPSKQLHVWAAGVDTDFFNKIQSVYKTQDYFIYFKSQNYDVLRHLHAYLFANYFKMTGTILTYYHYTPEMLRQAAQASRFCIFVDGPETQGLASLEIMACDCPLIVVDEPDKNPSVTCWDTSRCGMKCTFSTIEKTFPAFMERLESYKPREFVCESYSFEAAARSLRSLLESA